MAKHKSSIKKQTLPPKKPSERVLRSGLYQLPRPRYTRYGLPVVPIETANNVYENFTRLSASEQIRYLERMLRRIKDENPGYYDLMQRQLELSDSLQIPEGKLLIGNVNDRRHALKDRETQEERNRRFIVQAAMVLGYLALSDEARYRYTAKRV